MEENIDDASAALAETLSRIHSMFSGEMMESPPEAAAAEPLDVSRYMDENTLDDWSKLSLDDRITVSISRDGEYEARFVRLSDIIRFIEAHMRNHTP